MVSERISTIEGLGPEPDLQFTVRRGIYTVTTLVLTVIIGLAVVDGIDWLDVYGVDTSTVSASAGGYELEVRYGTVSRPALATPFEIVVVRRGGFDGPVTIAVDRDYLAMWDENGLTPAPSAETTSGDSLQWEFDPPEGDTLRVFYDARIEPAAQSGRSGAVAVVDGGAQVVHVDFHTRVLP